MSWDIFRFYVRFYNLLVLSSFLMFWNIFLVLRRPFLFFLLFSIGITLRSCFYSSLVGSACFFTIFRLPSVAFESLRKLCSLGLRVPFVPVGFAPDPECPKPRTMEDRPVPLDSPQNPFFLWGWGRRNGYLGKV